MIWQFLDILMLCFNHRVCRVCGFRFWKCQGRRENEDDVYDDEKKKKETAGGIIHRQAIWIQNRRLEPGLCNKLLHLVIVSSNY